MASPSWCCEAPWHLSCHRETRSDGRLICHCRKLRCRFANSDPGSGLPPCWRWIGAPAERPLAAPPSSRERCETSGWRSWWWLNLPLRAACKLMYSNLLQAHRAYKVRNVSHIPAEMHLWVRTPDRPSEGLFQRTHSLWQSPPRHGGPRRLRDYSRRRASIGSSRAARRAGK